MRLPLAIPLDARNSDETIDARMSNMLVEMYEDKAYVVNRAGLSKLADQTGAANGVMAFNGELISLFGEDIYKMESDFEFGSEVKLSDAPSGSRFGISNSITGTGEFFVIGAYWDSSLGVSRHGSVFFYSRNGSSVSKLQKILPELPGSNGQFGLSVKISQNGNYLAVSGFESSVAYTFLYRKVLNQFVFLKKIASGFEFDFSGDENTLAIAQTDSVDIYENTGGDFSYSATIVGSDTVSGDSFGASISLSGDGTTCAVGASAEDTAPFSDNGAVYIFVNSSGWSQQQKISPQSPANSLRFGINVSLDSTGDTLIASTFNATSQGTIQVFTRNAGVWSFDEQISEPGGASSASFGFFANISSDAGRIFASAYQKFVASPLTIGVAYVFEDQSGSWTLVQTIIQSDFGFNTNFSYAGEMSDDGNNILCGAWLANKSYLFLREEIRVGSLIDTVAAGTYDFAQTST